jgi:hypothetical protein
MVLQRSQTETRFDHAAIFSQLSLNNLAHYLRQHC